MRASVTRGPPAGRRCPSRRPAPPSATPRSRRTGSDKRCPSPGGPLPRGRCQPRRPGPGRRLQAQGTGHRVLRWAGRGWGEPLKTTGSRDRGRGTRRAASARQLAGPEWGCVWPGARRPDTEPGASSLPPAPGALPAPLGTEGGSSRAHELAGQVSVTPGVPSRSEIVSPPPAAAVPSLARVGRASRRVSRHGGSRAGVWTEGGRRAPSGPVGAPGASCLSWDCVG